MAGRSNNSFIKKKKAEERIKKRKEKQKKKSERRENSPGGGLDNMIAYVDKFGNISSEPPAEPIVKNKENKTTNSNQ